MSRHRKDRGLRTERVLADYFRVKGWHGAAVGRGAGKDIVNIPIDVEIKARSDFSPLAWLRQSKKRGRVSGEPSFVIVRCNGQGETPEDYLAFTDLATLTELLLKAGYGDIQKDSVELEPERCAQCGSWKLVGVLPCRVCQTVEERLKRYPNADL